MSVFGVIALCVRGFHFAEINRNWRRLGRSTVGRRLFAQEIVFRIHKWSVLKLICKGNCMIWFCAA